VNAATFLLAWSTGAFAFVDCEVRTVGGPTLARATVLVEGPRIRRVGPDATVPAGTQKISCDGRVLTPGLIEPDTDLGLVEIGLEPLSNDADVQVGDDPVRASLRARDAADPRSTLVGVARRQGVTSVVIVPRAGLVTGQAAWMDLVGVRSIHVDDAVSGPAGLVVNHTEDGAQFAGMSRLVAFAHLREFLDDAKTFVSNRSAYVRRSLYAMPWSRLDLEAAAEVVRRRQPLLVRVHRAADIVAVLDWARNSRLDLVLLGVSEGWMVADQIAEAGVPVAVNPFANLPFHFEARHARSDNATILDRAGVQVMLSSSASHRAGTLRFRAGTAVREGLDPDRALAAITRIPAQVFGRPDLGVIEAGATANLVLWTGDPFEPASHADVVMVRGEMQPVKSRQTALAEHHMRRLGLEDSR
jgi:imidazolonepropionase-like amidohydrolase